MRTRASMGKMVNKLTKREKSESFMMIDRIARGVNHPYTKEFTPTVVSRTDVQTQARPEVRENPFRVAEQGQDNVVVMRQKEAAPKPVAQMVFPEVFYEYFEVIDKRPQKTG